MAEHAIKYRHPTRHGVRFRLDPEGIEIGHRQDLSGLVFECVDFSRLNLTHCDMTGASFVDCRFSASDFSHAVLRDCKFVRPEFGDAVFGFTDLTGAEFEGSKAVGVQFFECVLDRAVLSGEFSFMKMIGCSASGAKFMDIDGFSAVIKRSTFDNCEFENVGLTGGGLTDVSFVHCQIARTEFGCLESDGAKFVDSLLVAVSFREAFFCDALIDRCRVHGSRLIEFRAEHTIWNESIFESSFFDKADMSGIYAQKVVFIDPLHTSTTQWPLGMIPEGGPL